MSSTDRNRRWARAAFCGMAFALAGQAKMSAACAQSVPANDPCGDSNLLATTDRPTFGTNPCVVKQQDAIAEFGYRNVTTAGGGNTDNTVSAPNNRTRIGLVKNVELILDTPSALSSTTDRMRVASGLSDIGTGLKYEFGYFGSFVHGIAGGVVYPTADTAFTNGRPSFNGSYQIGGGIVKNVGFNLTLGFVNFATPQTPKPNVVVTAFAPTLIIGAAVASATKLNVEIAGNSSNGPNTSGEYFGNTFLQHQFTKYLLIDVEAAQRLTVVEGKHQRYVGAGGSIRL